MALDKAAANEVVHGAAGGRQRDQDQLGQLLERQLAVGVLEVVQQLDLGQRQLERPDRLEQVRVAVLVEEHDSA